MRIKLLILTLILTPLFAAAGDVILRLEPEIKVDAAEVSLSNVESRLEIKELKGRKAWVSVSDDKNIKHRFIYVDIKDKMLSKGASSMQQVSIEYLDNFHGEFEFSYDSSDQMCGPAAALGSWKYGGFVRLHNTGEWKRKDILLRDAYFANRCNGFDFRLTSRGGGDLTVGAFELQSMSGLPKYPKVTKEVKGNRKNVLMIIVDDLNARIESFGFKPIITPNIDAFTETGMKFNKAYCQYPVCGPSRASFLTGRYPEKLKVLGNSTSFRASAPDSISVLEHFKNNGYWTAGAGKVFHSLGNVEEIGASTYTHDWMRDGGDPQHDLLKEQFEKKVGPIGENQKEWQEYRKENWEHPERHPKAIGAKFEDSLHMDVRSATRVKEWIDNKAFGENPFFIACGIVRPHLPFYAPQRFYDKYPIEDIEFEPVPEDDWDDIPAMAEHDKYKSYKMTFGVNEPEKRAKWIQAYHACLTFADSLVGDLLSCLKKNGLDENTIVVFVSDHGYHMGEHFMYGKVTLWEEVVRVPFAMRVPGLTKAGSECNGLTELVDIYPTLCDLTELPKPSTLQGYSLVPYLKGQRTDIKESAYTVVSRYPKKGPRTRQLGRSVRVGSFRYTEWGDKREQELYDLKSDPKQYTNLAKNAKYSDTIANLQSILASRQY